MSGRGLKVCLFVMSSLHHLLGSAILVSLSLPLAILAVITTSLAFFILSIKVAIVQVELVAAFITSWISTTTTTSPVPTNAPPIISKTANATQNHYLGHFNVPRDTSLQPVTSPYRPPVKSESFASLLGNGGPARDFEGVGGWRPSNDGADDAVWLSLNSRLELPKDGSNHTKRHHNRSRSSQSISFRRSPESLPANSQTQTLDDAPPQLPTSELADVHAPKTAIPLPSS